MSGTHTSVDSRELALAMSTERWISWFRIIGGIIGIVLTVTDVVVHPALERNVEVASLGFLSLVGAAALLRIRRGVDRDQLRQLMRVTFAVDALVMLAQPVLHSFTVLEAPSPSLLVPVVGAVRFGRRGAIAGIVGVAAAFVARAAIAVSVYGGDPGLDPAVVSIVLAAVLGMLTAQLFETARQGRIEADAATRVAEEATARTAVVHRVLADGVGGGVAQVADRLAGTIREVTGADAVRLHVAGGQHDPTVTAESARDGVTAADAVTQRAVVRYGDTQLGALDVVGAALGPQDLDAIAQQVGLAVHAARLLDREAALAARYRALDTMRRDFVALTTHELRTPVAAIVGAAETLLTHGGRLDSESQTDLVELAHRQASRLGRLVADLITVGRTDAGTLDYRPKYVPVRRIVDEVAAGLTGTFAVEGSDDLEVWVDPDRATQVLLNLVDNAFEHGVEPVLVSWVEHGDLVRVRVVDDGPGIAESQLEQVFERFVQLEPVQHHTRGTGLGLGISRDLSRAMGGDVLVDLEASTTTFVLDLPQRPVGDADEA